MSSPLLTTLLLLLLLLSLQQGVVVVVAVRKLNFAMIAGNSPFFEPVQQGWEKNCELLNINCQYLTPEWVNSTTIVTQENGASTNETIFTGANGTATPCIDLLKDLIRRGQDNNDDDRIDGIAMALCSTTHSDDYQINQTVKAGIPLVLFDTDAEHTLRNAYIGTDQQFLGRTLARLLKQLRPEGGTFAPIGIKAGRSEAFAHELMKDNHRNDRAHWYPVHTDFEVTGDHRLDYMVQMQRYAVEQNPTAMITMMQTPMRHENWTHFVDTYARPRHMTLIGTDGADYQLDYLHRRYVDGLVGQLPYDMGWQSVQVLYELATRGYIDHEIYSTNLVTHSVIPLELPPLQENQNLLGNVKYVGIVCFVIVALLSCACMIWTTRHRSAMVVRTAQPFFLVMIAGGALILAATIIPLSFDDNGGGGDASSESMSETKSVAMCMSVPWLAFVGFTIIFSALFSKTWRVNRLFLSSGPQHARIRVHVHDVMAPFAVLLSLNIIILTCWTVIDPLMYVRQFDPCKDFWNREISSAGRCRCENAAAYLVPLGLLNFIVLCMACYQAIQARFITSEFSEAKYIGLAVGSMMQAFLTGIPCVAIVRDNPKAFYLVLTLVIFILCMLILLLIFVPKVSIQKRYSGMTESEQKLSMAQSVRVSSGLSSSFASPTSAPLAPVNEAPAEEEPEPKQQQQQQH
jgi:7 transmembrane sweet-taste receptor of 3 GCPR/Periplasmic binding protein domain